MKDTQYAFCVARIRALENKLLTKQDVNSLINQKDFASAFSFLVQKGYAKENEVIDETINRQRKELHKILSDCVPDKNELEALYILNDYFNIKVLIKCIIENINPEIYIQLPSNVRLPEEYKLESLSEFLFLDEEYRSIAKTAYNIALKSQNGKFSDAVIDKEAIDALALRGNSKKKELLNKICAFLADTANIKNALRCATTAQNEEYINEATGKCCKLNRNKLINSTVEGYDSLVSYLATTDYRHGVEIYTSKPAGFEKWCDDTIIDICSQAVYTSFGFSPVVSYFYRKNIEIKTIAMILTALKSDVNREIIKERLRSLYA